ncbi:aldolase/citrate lyase family protein [Nocardia sp. NPDC050799]|uniref:HpcH/HpaI aldolase/citrate lyase family protein n=1 Tax=Nocardia sp. NPDC050799 TaxID=3154842 RepID=UPI0034022E26
MSDYAHGAGGVALPSRRALLFVPAHRERYVAGAARAGADGAVLDLEDSVPESEKPAARAALPADLAALAGVSLVIVRVNAGDDLEADLTACRDAGVTEVLLPKVDDTRDIATFDALCERLGYRPDLSVLVESSKGQRHLDDILARPGITTVALGVEDLRAEIELHAPRRTQTSSTIVAAMGDLVLAAFAHGVTPLGIAGSIAELRDEELFARGARAAFAMGMRGSYCIHPRQVPHLLREFSPSPADRDWARRVLAAGEEAARAGRGAFVVDNAMVDAPLVDRARRILAVPATRPDLANPADATPLASAATDALSLAPAATSERNPL